MTGALFREYRRWGDIRIHHAEPEKWLWGARALHPPEPSGIGGRAGAQVGWQIDTGPCHRPVDAIPARMSAQKRRMDLDRRKGRNQGDPEAQQQPGTGATTNQVMPGGRKAPGLLSFEQGPHGPQANRDGLVEVSSTRAWPRPPGGVSGGNNSGRGTAAKPPLITLRGSCIYALFADRRLHFLGPPPRGAILSPGC